MWRLSAAALCLAAAAAAKPQHPHILFVLVDDFGWGEVGYHRETPTDDVRTPTIDRLVKEGVELNRHYVHMTCTPTRASFQSGRLPVHVLTQLASPCDKTGAIPRNMTGIAEKLKLAGYATHQVGKWDAGMTTPRHTPQGRGYDTSLNYFDHGNWMWTELAWQGSQNHRGDFPLDGFYDLWDTDRPAKELRGTGYEELLYRERMQHILQNHDQAKPLFLNYDSRMVHYPLQAPVEYQDMFSHIEDDYRRMYHAMVTFLDDQLKNVTDTMKELGMWDNTLMILSSDNGGYVKDPQGGCNTTTGRNGADDSDMGHGVTCFNGEAGANNYPLRGGKYSMWEGGVRVNAFASGGYLPEKVRGTRLDEMIHVADWYGTFCAMVGVDATDDFAAASGLPPVDSKNVWPLLSGGTTTSPRDTILVTNNLLIHKTWKYVPAGVNMIESERGGPAYPNATTASDPIDAHNYKCPKEGCLFDLANDLYETTNVAAEHPDVVAMMDSLLKEERKTIWAAPHGPDPDCKRTCTKLYGNFYGPWKEVGEV